MRGRRLPDRPRRRGGTRRSSRCADHQHREL